VGELNPNQTRWGHPISSGDSVHLAHEWLSITVERDLPHRSAEPKP
jgi:hypothetical protein